MKESAAWSLLRESLMKQAASEGKSIHAVRIESMVGSGIFDANLCYNGIECWLEGKYVPAFPVKPTSLVKTGMSKEQRVFAIRRLLSGGITFLWMKVGSPAVPGNPGGGNGWYLFKLDSVDIINKVQEGMILQEVLSHRFSSSKELACYFLSSLVTSSFKQAL